MKNYIESSNLSYIMIKWSLWAFTYMMTPFLIVFSVYMSIKENKFNPSILIAPILFFVFFYLFKKLKTHFFTIKMNDKVISYKRNEQVVNLDWEEIEKIGRVPFVAPPIYYLRTKHSSSKIYFPSSSYMSFLSISIGGFTLIRDFSKMGKHIRKMKKMYNIQ